MSVFRFVDQPPVADATTFVARVGKQSHTKAALLADLARALKFPSYFGHNWDALDELLRDLSWLPAEVRTVVIAHDALPLDADRTEQLTYVTLLRDLINASQSGPRRLIVTFPHFARRWIKKLLD